MRCFFGKREEYEKTVQNTAESFVDSPGGISAGMHRHARSGE
jgi:hypothetical protein